MANSGEVNVNIKVSATGDGAAKATKNLDGVAKAAKRVSNESKGALADMQGAVGKVQGAFGALRNVLTGFGIGALVTSMSAGIAKIASSFGAARKSAEEFAQTQSRLAQEKGIAALANDYAKMTDAINAAAAAENHHLEMIDIEVANRRKLAAAKLDSAKEDEIARLDANATDYAEQLDKIEKKYAALRAAQGASDAREDIVLARQKLNASADQTDKAAEAQDAASAVIEAKIRQARREKSAADFDAVNLNEHDKTGAASAVGKTLGQLFTGDWGRMADAKTAEGDAVRNAAADKSAALEKQIAALTEELRKSNEAAARLRQEAANTRDKANAMSGSLQAADIAGDNARRAAQRGTEAAQRALDKNHADSAAEAAKLADAQKARQLLAAQKADLKAQIAAQQAKKDAAGKAVYEAQGSYDLARLDGSRSAQSAALATLQQAQSAAQNVNFAADSAITALTKTLQSVEARLKAAQAHLKSQSKRQNYAWAESPAGA